MAEVGSGAKKNIEDVKLSRYACYLIVQNADLAKEIVVLGQAKFCPRHKTLAGRRTNALPVSF